jgi:hypothetical protein
MNSENRSKSDTLKKVDFEKAYDLAKSKMEAIRASNSTNAIKSQQERRLGRSCLTALAGRSSRSDDNKASLSYLNREVTRLRTAIRHDGFIRHDFNSNIKALAVALPIADNELMSLVNVEYSSAKNLVSDVLAKLANREQRTKDKDKKSQLKKAIAGLKRTKFEPHLFETLVRTTEQKSALKSSANDRVEGYHELQRPVDYNKTYELMGEMLSSEHVWPALTLGLVLASGRRSTEILCSKDGVFKKTRNSHEAEFTSTVKTKEAKTYKIPLLVDFDIFISALDRLRDHPRIVELMGRANEIDNYDERHRLINSSVQHQLNEFVKNKMGGKEWALKDGRAMFARIAYAEYCAIENKAGRLPMVDDLFFKRKLGHTDAETQQNYKRFVLTGADVVNDREVKRTKANAKELATTEHDRLTDLKELFSSDDIQESRAFKKYANFVIEQVEADQAVSITSSWIKRELGGNKGIISKFVKIVREAGLQKAL